MRCVHLHIVNGRIVYARCVLGHVLFEKYGEGRQDPAAHTCPEYQKLYRLRAVEDP